MSLGEIVLMSTQLQPQPVDHISDDEAGWLNDSEEQLQAEDALWEATSVRHREKFAALAAAARVEIAVGVPLLLYS